MNPLALVLQIGTQLIDKLWPDPIKKAEAITRLTELQQAGDLAVIAGQIEINKIEAASPSLFVSGWRPFVGWLCGVGLGTQIIVGPLLSWGSALAGHPLTLPPMNIELLTTTLIGMLGFGGLRTYEKINGVAAK